MYARPVRHGQVSRALRAAVTAALMAAGTVVALTAAAPAAQAQSGLEFSKSTTTFDDLQFAPNTGPTKVQFKQSGLDAPDESSYPTAFADIYTSRAAVVEVQASRIGSGPVASLASWMAPNDTNVTVDTADVSCSTVSGSSDAGQHALNPDTCSGAAVTAVPQAGGVSTTGVIYVADDFTQVSLGADAAYAGPAEFHAVKGATLHVPAPGIAYGDVTGLGGEPCVASTSALPAGLTLYTNGAMTYTPPNGAAGGKIDFSYGLGKFTADGADQVCAAVTPGTTGTITIYLSGTPAPTVIPIVVIGTGHYGDTSMPIPQAFAIPSDPAEVGTVDVTSVMCTQVWDGSAAVSDLSTLGGSQAYPIYPNSCAGAKDPANPNVIFSYSGIYYVAPADQTLSFTGFPDTAPTHVGVTFTPVATSTSGLNPVVSVTGGCSLDAATGVVTITSVEGNCVVSAGQAGDADYAATRISQTVQPAPHLTVQTTAALGESIPVSGAGWPAGSNVAVTLYDQSYREIDRTTVPVGADGLLPSGTALPIPSDVTAGEFYVAAESPGVAASKLTEITIRTKPRLSVPAITAAGGQIAVSGDGWPAGSDVSIVIYDPNGTETGRIAATADTDGRIPARTTLTAPSGASTGLYSVRGTGGGSASAPSDVAVNGPLTQTLSFTAGTVPDYSLGYGEKFKPAATSDRGLTPTISASGACSLDSTSGVVTMTASSGNCTLTADQAGNAYYEPDRISESVAASKAMQNLAWVPDTVPSTGLARGATFTPVAVSDAGLIPVINASGACQIDRATGVVTMTSGTGECALSATQGGGLDYSPASSAVVVVAALAASQSITLAAPTSGVVGESVDLTSDVSASSGLPVALTVDQSSAPADACSLSGSTVSFAHAGSCVIDANQAGNSDFAAAPQQQETITIGKAAQAITFTSTAPDPAHVGDSYTVTASGGHSGNPVLFTSSGAACTISGSIVSFVQAGTCSITATQAGNDDYTPAPAVHQDVSVERTTTSLHVQPISLLRALLRGRVTYSATLTTTSGTPIAGQSVTFASRRGFFGAAVTCTGVTDSDGVAACSVHGLLSWFSPITARYAGNDTYSPSTATGDVRLW